MVMLILMMSMLTMLIPKYSNNVEDTIHMKLWSLNAYSRSQQLQRCRCYDSWDLLSIKVQLFARTCAGRFARGPCVHFEFRNLWRLRTSAKCNAVQSTWSPTSTGADHREDFSHVIVWRGSTSALAGLFALLPRVTCHRSSQPPRQQPWAPVDRQLVQRITGRFRWKICDLPSTGCYMNISNASTVNPGKLDSLWIKLQLNDWNATIRCQLVYSTCHSLITTYHEKPLLFQPEWLG